MMTGSVPSARVAALRSLRDPRDGQVIDRGLVLFLPGPGSFTGEDSAEFQLHGGRAVVAACVKALGALDGVRVAEPGEFTRRAFENGKMDLTAVEALGDLIAAETEGQRRQAVNGANGAFARRADGWRSGLLAARAAVEAELDFSDEEDVPDSLSAAAFEAARAVLDDMRGILADALHGERMRDGFTVALMGPPNAGKSSLLNALTRRDVAIVTDVPGTTRDILEVHLDLGGYPVTLVDTAGLREAMDVVEAEGIRRGRRRGAGADLILWLSDTGQLAPEDVVAFGVPLIAIRSKADLGGNEDLGSAVLSVSVQDDASISRLIDVIAQRASDGMGGETALISRERQRRCVEDAATAIQAALKGGLPLEVVADSLRRATDAVGRLTGRIDVEDVLGSIFSSFCIGK